MISMEWEKTEIMRFNWEKLYNDHEIKIVSEYKYLGVILYQTKPNKREKIQTCGQYMG